MSRGETPSCLHGMWEKSAEKRTRQWRAEIKQEPAKSCWEMWDLSVWWITDTRWSSSLLPSDYMVNPNWVFQNFVVSSMVSPWPLVNLIVSCGQSDAGTLRGCLSSPSRQGTEGLSFTVPWRKCSGSCQPKANWKSHLLCSICWLKQQLILLSFLTDQHWVFQGWCWAHC